MNSNGSAITETRYTGREFDPETGLNYQRARYYDFAAGRFISEDPIGFTGGINFYPYVRNNPINFFDPEGLLEACCRPAYQPVAQFIARPLGHEEPCHCFLRLANGHTLGGYFNRDPKDFGSLVKNMDDKTDKDKYAAEASVRRIRGKFLHCSRDLLRHGFNMKPLRCAHVLMAKFGRARYDSLLYSLSG